MGYETRVRLRLGVIDRQRYAALHRPANGEQYRKGYRRSCDCKISQSYLLHRLAPILLYPPLRKERLRVDADIEKDQVEGPIGQEF